MEYVGERGIPYVVDSTNSDNAYRRNYVRNVLIKDIERNINPSAVAALNRLSGLAENDIDFLESAAKKAFGECAAVESGRVCIDNRMLKGYHVAVAGRVIKLACARLGVCQDVEKAHVDAVMDIAANGRTGARANLSGNLSAALEYDRLIISFVGREKNYSFEMRFDINDKNVMPNGDYIECSVVESCDTANRDGYCECFDMDKLPGVIARRTRHDGDLVKPLGAPGKKKLKDYFIDKKLSREQRAKTPLLANGSDIIWVVGHVISDNYRVDGDTKRIVKMTYTERKA
jgi:tRNA(Ile)-lysidine synthase